MEEKKLTDEEIVKAFEHCNKSLPHDKCLLAEQHKEDWVNCQSKCGRMIIDLIHRLQEDYLKLKEKYVKVLDLNEKVIAEQNAKIEHLENETTYLQRVADAFKGDYKNAKADGVRELLQQLIEMEIKLDPLRSGIRYKALVGYAEENGVEVDL